MFILTFRHSGAEEARQGRQRAAGRQMADVDCSAVGWAGGRGRLAHHDGRQRQRARAPALPPTAARIRVSERCTKSRTSLFHPLQ